MRRAAWEGGLAVGVALAVALTSCSSSPKTASPATPAPASRAATAPRPVPGRSFTLAEPDVAAYGTPPLLPIEARNGAQTLLDQYLDRAVLTPLRSGHAGDLAPLFTAPALDRLNGPDRAALVDEGLGSATDVALGTASAQLTALIGPEGVHLLVAGINLVVDAKVAGAPLTIHRSGELTLVVDGDAWKIMSYDVQVARDGPQ
jgi:hypothetical protein